MRDLEKDSCGLALASSATGCPYMPRLQVSSDNLGKMKHLNNFAAITQTGSLFLLGRCLNFFEGKEQS